MDSDIKDWKSLENVGYSRYSVSEDGKLWDNKRDIEVSQFLSGIPEYRYANVWNDEGKRKQERVHRLVAFAFVDGWSEDYNVVDHIDRDKLNNHYTNLRWTDNSGNQRNIENNLISSDGVYLKDFVEIYENPIAAYSYIAKLMNDGVSFEAAHQKYEEFLDYGLKRGKIEFDGELYYLTDFCDKFNVQYEKARNKLNEGFEPWQIAYNLCYVIGRDSFEIKGSNLVNHWIPNKLYLANHLGVGEVWVQSALDKATTYEDILAYDKLDHLRFEFRGVYGTAEEICKHFGTTYSAVGTKMKRKGLTFEEAIDLPRQRIKAVWVNGVKDSPKNWFEKFGIDFEKVKNLRSKKKVNFEDILHHFGVDTTDMEIRYV